MFVLFQYMGSFPVAGPDQASRAEYMRTQLQQMRVSSLEYTSLSIHCCTQLKLIDVLPALSFEEHAAAIIETVPVLSPIYLHYRHCLLP
jgi:hypothetical protein